MECLYWLKDPKAHLVYLCENKNPRFCCVLWQSCGFTVANRVHANSNLLMSINRGREHFLRAKSSNFLPTYGAKCARLKRGQKAGGGWTLPGVNLEPVLLLSVGCVVYLSANHNSYFIHSDKGRPSGPNRLFFWTLFKRPLTPPPPPLVFEHLCCGFF